VDASVQALAGAVGYGRELHAKNLQTFNGAKERCFGLVESTVATAKALVDPKPYIAWASDKVSYYVDPDKVLDTSFEVAGKVATFGPGECASWTISVGWAMMQRLQTPITPAAPHRRTA
jgi:hypothetical protein